jgi:hypothetical protein
VALSLFVRRDLDDKKKNHRIADQMEKKTAAEDIIYGMKGINNGQNKKDYEGKGESNLSDS